MNLQKLVIPFIEKMKRFDYPVNGLDPIWKILFISHNEQWQYLHVLQYRESFTINRMIGEEGILQWNGKDAITISDIDRQEYEIPDARQNLIQEWELILEAAGKWLDLVEEDWIAANRKVIEGFPVQYRKGIIAKHLVYPYLPELFQWRKHLENSILQKFLNLTSEGEFANEFGGKVQKMSAKKYFEYCKIAYTINALSDDTIDTSLSGKEMYRRYADGRHEGLLDIDEQSEQEFADWLYERHPKRKKGGHPWEIRRGRIWLYVMRTENEQSFKIYLSGGATSNLVEEIRMYIAFREASLPVSISNLQQKRSRLCLQDDLGILPVFESTSHTEHEFETEEVYDGIYFEDLGVYKEQLAPFINWERLPLLIPRSVTRKKTKDKKYQIAALLNKHNLAVLSKEKRTRYAELYEKLETDTMTEVEQKEFLVLTGEEEKLRNERLKLLIQIAYLRNIPLNDLMKELGLKPVGSA